MKHTLSVSILILIFIFCFPSQTLSFEIPQSQHPISEIQIEHTAYTVSYNPDNKIPNWVAWKSEYVAMIDQRVDVLMQNR